MEESLSSQNRREIQDIIAEKAWYRIDPKEGNFDWERSLESLAFLLDVDKETLRLVIETSFSPDFLSSVEIVDSKTGKKTKKPLIHILAEEGYRMIIWTEGDERWQRRKIELVGLADLEKNNQVEVFISGSDKVGILGEILKKILSQNNYVLVVVADDKSEIIDQLTKMKEQYPNLLPYHIQLNDPDKDATAFYSWLKGHKANPSQTLVVLDLDGTVLDSHGVLLRPVVEKLIRIKKR